jgi:isoquinoline 1-oxidoreductase beta subunit
VRGGRAGWGARASGGGRGFGIAAHHSFNMYVASVVEVEVDGAGAVKVPAVHMIVDAGVIVRRVSRRRR